jgi:AbrB family looped-hinge helix DNA binding protein
MHLWYVSFMSGSRTIVVGDRGRLVLPADIRERGGIGEGTELIVLETPDGLALLTREQLKRRVRSELAGPSLVADLIEERRTAANAEGA